MVLKRSVTKYKIKNVFELISIAFNLHQYKKQIWKLKDKKR